MRSTLLLVAVLLTATTTAAQTLLRTLRGTTSQEFGRSVSGAGDVDGDGFDDVIVGAPRADGFRGRAVVFSGRTGAVLHTLAGDVSGDYFGGSVAGAGDADGDGFADVVVGARGQLNDIGYARVFSGRTGLVLHTLRGDPAGDGIGTCVRDAGDIDADGFDDVVIGAPLDDTNSSNAGAARVYSGRDGHVLLTVRGAGLNDAVGQVVSGAGDVDGDGFDDVLVNAPDAASQDTITAFSGRTGAVLIVIPGGWESAAGAGDVDGDGRDDVILGDATPGCASLYSGATGARLWRVCGGSSNDFGRSVGCAGDVDGDGRPDVIVGAPRHNGDTGAAFVFSGPTGAQLLVMYGEARPNYFGCSVGGAGDTNGDGFDDVIAGAYLNQSAGVMAGAAYLYSKGVTGTPATARAVGAGCVGTNGHLPRIDWSGRPFLGRAFSLDLRGALPRTPAVLNLGVPTAIPLTPIGLTGCTLYATGDGFVVPFATDARGLVDSGPVTVPNDPALLRFTMAGQWVCLDRNANAIGVTLSNAVLLTCGR